jgi:hypothetical protein
MANTEGLPDEAVASLLSPTPWNSSSASKNAASSASSRQKEALRKRMELPPGERPAARVVRSARRPATAVRIPAMADAMDPDEDEEDESYENSNEKSNEPVETPLTSVLGSIVERTVSRNPAGKQLPSKDGKQSRFARQRQLQAPSAGGFPSVNAPLGTFVRGQPKTKQTARALIPPVKTAPLSSVDSLLQASSRDARAMMGKMSPTDIRESVQELASSMSPDTLAFLKKRAAQRQAGTQPASAGTTNSNIPLPTPTTAATVTPRDSFDANPKLAKASNTSVEKDRLAQVLSSIKTYDDLDAAYAAEMGALEPEAEDTATPAAPALAPSPAAVTDDFDLAASLLRSTVARQNLWAARVVYHRLQDDWEKGRLCSVRGGSGTTPWPYPAFLPVSRFPSLSTGCIVRTRERIRPSYLCAAVTLHVVETTSVLGSCRGRFRRLGNGSFGLSRVFHG